MLDTTIASIALTVPTLVLYFALLGATGVGTVGARLLQVNFVTHVSGPIDGTELVWRVGEYLYSVARALFTGRAKSDIGAFQPTCT